MLMTNLLVAFGTIAVAIVAVLGHSVRFRFMAPRFDLHYNEGDIDILNGKAWFHLQILVRRCTCWDWLFLPLPATNCRVMLRRIEGDGVDDRSWCPSPTPALQFKWPLQGDTEQPSFRSIAFGEDVRVDIGELSESEGLFKPLLYQYKSKFGHGTPSKDGEYWGCVVPGKPVTYHLYFVCDQFASRDYKFEVSWDGQFSPERRELAQHLKIKKVEYKSYAVLPRALCWLSLL
jgi:hypothetical protein